MYQGGGKPGFFCGRNVEDKDLCLPIFCSPAGRPAGSKYLAR